MIMLWSTLLFLLAAWAPHVSMAYYPLYRRLIIFLLFKGAVNDLFNVKLKFQDLIVRDYLQFVQSDIIVQKAYSA